jgi:hypothetical protein
MKYTKHAAGAGFVQGMRNAAKDPAFWTAMGGIATTAGAVTGVGAIALKKLKDTQETARSYKEMFELNPRLRSHDPKQVKRLFGTLSRFGPELAKDPTVAGAWITNTISKEEDLADFGPGHGALQNVMSLVTASRDITTAAKNRPGTLDPLRSWAGVGDMAAKPLHSISDALTAAAGDDLTSVRRENDLMRAMEDNEKLREGMKARAKKAAQHFSFLR